MGLGALPTVTLAAARAFAARCRAEMLEGQDPVSERAKRRHAARARTTDLPTFEACAKAYLASHEEAWKNAKHRQQWRNTLKAYAYPIIGHVPVADLTTEHVTRVLTQSTERQDGVCSDLWAGKPDTASRLRGRIEVILDWARVRGFRAGENPARWRGHLQSLLPASKKLRLTVHHAALPYDQVPDLFSVLSKLTSVSARALQFVILTAVGRMKYSQQNMPKLTFRRLFGRCLPVE